MQFISRSTFVALLAVLAVSAIGAASASAAECPGTGEGLELCSGGHALTGTFEFTGQKESGTGNKIKVEGGHVPECTNTTSLGKLVATIGKVEVAHQSMQWTGCRFTGFPTCRTHLAFGTGVGLHGTWAIKGEEDEVSLSATEPKELFGEFTSEGCEYEAIDKFTGSQKCSLRKSAVEATTHTESCSEPQSALKVGAKVATMEVTEAIKLTSGKAFSLQRG